MNKWIELSWIELNMEMGQIHEYSWIRYSALTLTLIPLYHYCTYSLAKSLENFKQSDDIYVGIKAAIEKLNHYYDQISPMIGIALILDPKRKVQYLQNTLKWEDAWVQTTLRHFQTSFNYYRQRVPNEGTSNSIPTAIGGQSIWLPCFINYGEGLFDRPGFQCSFREGVFIWNWFSNGR